MRHGAFGEEALKHLGGALRLYEEARNSKREMLEGVGYGKNIFEVGTYIVDWFTRQLGAIPV